MKVVSFIVISLVLIIGFGIFTTTSINSSAEKLTHHIDILEENIVEEKWKESSQSSKEISRLWSETKKTWLLFLDHQEIDNIDLTYARLNKYIEAKDLPSALAEVAALKLLVKHIPDISALTLRNIF